MYKALTHLACFRETIESHISYYEGVYTYDRYNYGAML